MTDLISCEWCGKAHVVEDMNRLVNWPDTSGPIYVCHKCHDRERVCPECLAWTSIWMGGIDRQKDICPTCHGNGIVPKEG